MTALTVLASLWIPIILGYLAFTKARGRWDKPLQALGWLCVLYSVGWFFQWIFFTERWWQLTSWMKEMRLF